MCARYIVEPKFSEEIERALRQIEKRLKMMDEIDDSVEKECRPTDEVPVITLEKDDLVVSKKRFGMVAQIPGERSDGSLVINARSESILQKPLFSHAFEKHRVVIPASAFIEWNSKKEKSKFRPKNGKILYFAGCYQKDMEGDRFVIITTGANASMEAVHDRMPLTLEEGEILTWLSSSEQARKILTKVPDELQRETEYEQMSLFG